MPHISILLLGAFCMSTCITAAHADTPTRTALESVAHLANYPVVELRRYDIAPGQRDRFVRYFGAKLREVETPEIPHHMALRLRAFGATLSANGSTDSSKSTP